MKMQVTFNGETRVVNFTEPQARIMERLNNGERATYVNCHHMDGGDFVWFRKDGYYWGKEYVGYKAFNGAMFAIVKAFNLRGNSSEINKLYDTYIIQ